MPQDLTDDKSTLVQVMAWCRQTTSHYLSQCWLSPLSSYGVARPQWVNDSPVHWHIHLQARDKEERYLRRQQRRADLEEKRKQREEERVRAQRLAQEEQERSQCVTPEKKPTVQPVEEKVEETRVTEEDTEAVVSKLLEETGMSAVIELYRGI